MKTVFIQRPSLHNVFGISGIKPYRSSGPNLSFQLINRKKIFNCYGHGGKGWSTLFGSINDVLELITQNNISKNEKITVLGAGCFGLTLAACLKKQNYQVEILAAEFYDIASYKAGANFAIGLTRERDLHRAKINYNFLKLIQEGKHEIIKPESIQKIKAYAHQTVLASYFKLAQDNVCKQPEAILLDTGYKLHQDFRFYTNFFIDVNLFMQNLKDYLLVSQVSLISQKVTSFEQIDSSIIINCTGLGARELLNDNSLTPTPTQLIAFQDSPLDYILQSSKTDQFYIYPKNNYTNHNGENLKISGIVGGIKQIEYAKNYSLNLELINQKMHNFFGH